MVTTTQLTSLDVAVAKLRDAIVEAKNSSAALDTAEGNLTDAQKARDEAVAIDNDKLVAVELALKVVGEAVQAIDFPAPPPPAPPAAEPAPAAA
jgi:peptidoglycan hydrolase CwlO-like protein